MMDTLDHWATLYTCSCCRELPEKGPLFHCKNRHHYCSQCFGELEINYCGKTCVCKVCELSSPFEIKEITDELLAKLKDHRKQQRQTQFHLEDASGGDQKPAQVTLEYLFGLPEEEVNKLLLKSNHYDGDEFPESASAEYLYLRHPMPTTQTPAPDISSKRLGSTTSFKSIFTTSRKPLVCPHYTCKRIVAVSSLSSHFNHEHPKIQRLQTERGKAFTFFLEPENICHGLSYCQSILNVYESNHIDVHDSKSSQGVIRTCARLSQRIPYNTFWLLVGGSPQKRRSISYVILWLLSSTDDKYKCTIELCSNQERESYSTFCEVNPVHASTGVEDVARRMGCLLLPHGSFVSLLRQGTPLKLKITVL